MSSTLMKLHMLTPPSVLEIQLFKLFIHFEVLKTYLVTSIGTAIHYYSHNSNLLLLTCKWLNNYHSNIGKLKLQK